MHGAEKVFQSLIRLWLSRIMSEERSEREQGILLYNA